MINKPSKKHQLMILLYQRTSALIDGYPETAFQSMTGVSKAWWTGRYLWCG